MNYTGHPSNFLYIKNLSGYVRFFLLAQYLQGTIGYGLDELQFLGISLAFSPVFACCCHLSRGNLTRKNHLIALRSHVFFFFYIILL